MVLVLAAAAVFVYVRLQSDLNATINVGLDSRSADLAAAVERGGAGRLTPTDESFAQVLTPSGRVVAGPRDPALRPAEAARATRAGIEVERRVTRVEGPARLLARRVPSPDGPVVVVVGAALDDRDEALRGVLTSFLIGGAVAVIVASGIGYLLAAAALSPVEAMRRRAAQVSLDRGAERLPLPPAHDEIRRLGETLNDMLARLQASFERERRFVADASHELRTPLSVLKTELETALRRGGHAPEVRESLVAAVEEADHLAQLAEDLLLVARAADGRLPVRPEDVDVADLLEQARERFGDRAREQGRAIAVDPPDGLHASLDPLRLRQALGNLVDNALRHGVGNVSLAARSRDGAVEIDVGDEGPGFPADLESRAFERFTRGDAARMRGGSGLGLAIVSAIAAAHGGSATIADGAGGRTTVRLRLPLRSISSAPARVGGLSATEGGERDA
jgi:two-component system, OmpR family, sensor kinase